MEILGVGITEILFVALLALVILGPKDLQKTMGAIGKGLRKLVMSDFWKVMRETSQEIDRLPAKLIREADKEAGGVAPGGMDKIRLPTTTELLDALEPKPGAPAGGGNGSLPTSAQEPKVILDGPQVEEKEPDA